MRNFFNLASIGASDSVLSHFARYAGEGLSLARVCAVHRSRFTVYLESGEANVSLLGALLYRGEIPTVGDWVAVSRETIHAILPRTTLFSRRAAGLPEHEQLIAANVDVVFIVCGLDHDYQPRRLERYLTLVRESAARAVVVLSKADLCLDLPAQVQAARQVAQGAPAISVSSSLSDGADPLRQFLGAGITAALVGSSGAGKSTLVNRLLGEDRQRTHEVRASDSRGRHTTTHRELIPLPNGGGALIDSPGMRELQLWAQQSSLDATFDDIIGLASQCKYRDCVHRGETGCAVQGAVDPDRLRSYHKLGAEIAWHDQQADVNLAQARKQRWKVIHKAMRSAKDRFPHG